MPWILNIDRDERARERLYWLLAGATISLGVALRLWGYFEYEFWFDEASWAHRTLRSVASPGRPVGYMYVSQWLARLYNTEPVLRLPSLVPSIVSLPLLLAVCRSARLSWPVSLLGLFLLAIHPWAITSSKEFKPYALELALHLALMLLAALYVQGRKTRDLVLFAALGALSPPFAFTVALLVPWLFFSLLALALHEKKKAHALIVFAGGTLTVLSMLAIFFVRLAGAPRAPGYWAKKYDVFYAGGSTLEHARWLFEKTAELAAFPARVRLFWGQGELIQGVIDWLHVAAVIAGCVYLLRRRSFFFFVVWVAPWLTALALAALRLWPYGAFRTNLFMLAYSLPLALCGLQYLWEAASARPPAKGAFVALALVLVLLAFPYRFSEAAQKTGAGHTASIRKGLELIKQHEDARGRSEGRLRLILDNHACGSLSYYKEDHAIASKSLGDFLDQRASLVCNGMLDNLQRRIRSASRRGGFWVLASKTKLLGRLEAYLVRRCAPDVLLHLPGPTLLAHCPPRVR